MDMSRSCSCAFTVFFCVSFNIMVAIFFCFLSPYPLTLGGGACSYLFFAIEPFRKQALNIKSEFYASVWIAPLVIPSGLNQVELNIAQR